MNISEGELSLLAYQKTRNPRQIAFCTREQQLAYAKKKYGERARIICRWNGTSIYIEKQLVEFIAYNEEIELEEKI